MDGLRLTVHDLRPTVYMLRGVTLVYLLKNAAKFLVL